MTLSRAPAGSTSSLVRISPIVLSALLVSGLAGCGDGSADDAGVTPGMDAGPSGSDGGAADAGAAMDGGGGVDAGASDGGAGDGGARDAAATDGGRSTRCDEGPLTCDALPPTCGELEVAAIRDGCWVCVNAITCRPWGEPGCASDQTCAPTERCDPCATGSCPFCEDCVAGCEAHGCPTETTLTCRCVRPDCGEGNVAVIDEGCWICVSLGSCAVVRDSCG